MNERKLEIIFLAIISLISSFLLFSNLGNRYMWQDEAQTSLIAMTVIDRGLPYGTDGKNFFSQADGIEYGKDYLWKWHPWLQFYVLAPFIKIFGFSNFISRLPFAFFALASVLLLYFLVKELFLSTRKAMLASLTLALYVPFLILGRQSRYYSPEMFFCLLGLFAYVRMTAGKKYAGLLYVSALTLLFHTIYIYFFALAAACAVHSLVFKRDGAMRVILFSAAATAFNMPFLFTIYRINFAGVHPEMFNPVRIAGALRSYTGFAMTELPGLWLILFVPVYLIAAVKFKKKLGTDGPEYKPGVMLLFFFTGSVFLCMSVFAHLAFYRNIAGTVPVFAAFAALLIAPMFHLNKPAGFLLTAVFIFTGRMPLFLQEITRDYDGPIEGIVKYLNENGGNDDTVLITYGDLPVKLYTEMKVYGGLGNEPYDAAKNADWIIIRKHVLDHRENITADFVRQSINREDYEMITIAYPDNYDENSERPSKHLFLTDKKESGVVIYKKRRKD